MSQQEQQTKKQKKQERKENAKKYTNIPVKHRSVKIQHRANNPGRQNRHIFTNKDCKKN